MIIRIFNWKIEIKKYTKPSWIPELLIDNFRMQVEQMRKRKKERLG